MQPAGTAPAMVSATIPGSFLLLTEILYLHGQITRERRQGMCPEIAGMRGWGCVLPEIAGAKGGRIHSP